MDLLIAFAVFLSVMAVTLFMGGSMIIPLAVGLVAFIAVGYIFFGLDKIGKKKPL
jgi:predicted membrane protein